MSNESRYSELPTSHLEKWERDSETTADSEEAPFLDSSRQRSPRSSRLLPIALVGLLALVVGLGAGYVLRMLTSAGNQQPWSVNSGGLPDCMHRP